MAQILGYGTHSIPGRNIIYTLTTFLAILFPPPKIYSRYYYHSNNYDNSYQEKNYNNENYNNEYVLYHIHI